MQLIGLLLLGAFVYLIVTTVWKFALVCAVVAVVFYSLRGCWRAADARWIAWQRNQAAIAKRADMQHKAYQAGDPYGRYGEYPPEEFL